MSSTNRGLTDGYGSGDDFASADLNTLIALIDAAPITGHTTRSIAGSTTPVTLTEAEYDAGEHESTGAITGNIEVVLPAWAGRAWIVYNHTTGAFTVTYKTASGSGVTVTQGFWAIVYCNGTDIRRLSPDVNAGGILAYTVIDTNGNEIVKYAQVSSATNEVTVTNAATGNRPSVAATGGDTNIDLGLAGKGTGAPVLVGGGKIGVLGTLLKQVTAGTVAINPASIAAGATGDTTFTLTGAAVGDIVLMNLPQASPLEAGLVFGGAWVSATNTVTVRLANVTGSPIDGASLTWAYVWIKLV